jgi:hypothetical protein
MKIKRNNEIIADVFLRKNSFVVEGLMGNHYIQLSFLSLDTIDLAIGDYVTYENNNYKIKNNETIKKAETSRGWEYTVTFYSSQYDLQDVSFFLHGAPERKKNFDYYNGTALQWAELIVENMNRVDSEWEIGTIIESVNTNLSFRDKSCAAVLSDLVNKLDTECWIDGKLINIGRREYASDGLTLGQGEGCGFKEMTLSAVDETPPITVIYPYGSDKNITSDYGNDYLVLPGGELSIEKNIDKYGRIEQSKQFEDIFPYGEFHVSEKIDNYTLKASDIDFNLTDCLINDVEVIVTFQNGALAGYDLAIVDGSWNNKTKQFKLKENEEENALKVPGDINFAEGDMFIFTGIKMPQSYIDAAENKLLEEATKYHDSVCEKRVQLSCKCDDIYFKAFNISIPCGKMIHIVSNPLGIDREIRCTEIKKYLENDRAPYRYEIVVSDFLRSDEFSNLIKDVKNVPGEISKSVQPVIQYTKRRFRDSLETIIMLEAALLDKFTNSVSPIAVQTMAMLVGDESLQFRFVNNMTSPTEVPHNVTYDAETKILTVPAGILQHLTLGINTLSSRHDISEYRFWALTEFNTPELTDGEKKYYLYAKVSKTGDVGGFYISETAISMEGVAGYYHLLMGILNSEYDGERSYVSLYGFTEILPGRMTTDKVVSSDGQNFIDFLNNAARIGNANTYMDFNTKGDGLLRIKGTLVQSQSGDEQPLGCFRGEYVNSYTYYKGDEVTYGGSTYRYVNGSAHSGYIPTNTTYWSNIAARGVDGVDGAYFEYRYALNGSTIAPPAINTTMPNPDGWTTGMPSVGSLQYIWMTVAKKSAGGTLLQNWSTPVRTNGADGSKGDTGPVPTYRGIYSNSATYYGTSKRVDIVQYNSSYYVAGVRNNADSGFVNKVPTDTTYWNSFGASFDSVATGLLLAEISYIENLIINRLSAGKEDSLSRLVAGSNEIGFYKNKSAESSISNALLRLGLAVGYMQTNGTNKPGLSVRDYEDDGSYSEITSEGIFTNGSNINALPGTSGMSSCISIAALLQKRILGDQYVGNSLNAAIYGYDQTSESAYSEGYGGYFNKLRANGLFVGNTRIASTTTLSKTDVFVSCYNDSAITVYLPANPYNGQVILMRRNNTASVTADGNGKTIINASTSSTIAVGDGQGDMGLFIYDGQSWTYNHIFRH